MEKKERKKSEIIIIIIFRMLSFFFLSSGKKKKGNLREFNRKTKNQNFIFPLINGVKYIIIYYWINLSLIAFI